MNAFWFQTENCVAEICYYSKLRMLLQMHSKLITLLRMYVSRVRLMFGSTDITDTDTDIRYRYRYRQMYVNILNNNVKLSNGFLYNILRLSLFYIFPYTMEMPFTLVVFLKLYQFQIMTHLSDYLSPDLEKNSYPSGHLWLVIKVLLYILAENKEH